MARTYRRQSGKQDWRTWSNWTMSRLFADYNMGLLTEAEMIQEIEKDRKNDHRLMLHYERDRRRFRDAQYVKRHSNRLFRNNQCKQLHKIKKMSDLEDYDYNDGPEIKSKHLWWVYD